jgi:hypothetical protein
LFYRGSVKISDRIKGRILMAKKINRVCSVCTQKYSYCPSCNEDWNKPTWMVLFHDENCKNIYTYANDYAHGDMSKEDAKVLLGKCDLTNLDNFHPVIKKTIMEILKVDEQEVAEEKADDSDQSAETNFTENKFSKKHKKVRY